MKKLNYFLHFIVAMLCCFSANAQDINYDFVVDGIYYKINADKPENVDVVKGDMEYKGDIILPETVNYKTHTYNVTKVGGRAFKGCTELTSIDLGNVTSIANGAFWNCTALTSIDMKNTETVGSHAFYLCTGLESIDFKNVILIGYGSFDGCTKLKSVDMKNIKTVGGEAFNSCTGLISVDLKNVEIIGDFAFNACTGLTSADLKNVTSIGNAAFINCSGLMSVDLKNVKIINSRAFKECTKIEYVKTSELETPSIVEDSFDPSVYKSAKLKVPVGRKQNYQDHTVWGKFQNIEENDATAINTITKSSVSITPVKGGITVSGLALGSPIKIYTQDGSLVANEISDGNSIMITVRPGKVYIIQAGNKTLKVTI